ncbi:MAG: type II toxin-antitoxin system HicA family toxin [Sphingobacteriales bacterium]|nr:MAG: type II toxin-antitoxin system HicA family toxin [Sphingobacteriales bacterium]
MKLPRNVNGKELAQVLVVLGYTVTRQTGSHLRLTTHLNGQHHITIPMHNPISIGTLSNILTEISNHHQMTKKELLTLLF